MSIPEDAYASRVQRVRRSLAAEELGALVVFDPHNVRYLTGFTGSAGVVIVRPDEVLLVSDFRYRLQAAAQAPGVRFIEPDDQLRDVLPSLLAGLDSTVGVEPGHLTVEQWRRLEGALDEVPHRFVEGSVERLRMIKEPAEVEAIRAAAAIVVGVLEHLGDMAVIGRTERMVALDLEMWVRTHGSEAVPFPYIVATGPRGAMPHAETSDAVLRRGDLLVVDIGAQVDGYASDVTRTYAVGSVGAEEQALHALVLEAQEAARGAAHGGMTCAELDEVARGVIEAAGKGELFKHGLGHGVGLDVHEDPRVSSRSTDVLTAGMVVTIEPGVYVPNVGGVRIEDTVLITETGIEVLSECDRGLAELG